MKKRISITLSTPAQIIDGLESLSGEALIRQAHERRDELQATANQLRPVLEQLRDLERVLDDTLHDATALPGYRHSGEAVPTWCGR